MTYRIALVTHDLSLGGGTATVVSFLHRILQTSGRFQPDIISLATSIRDNSGASSAAKAMERSILSPCGRMADRI